MSRRSQASDVELLAPIQPPVSLHLTGNADLQKSASLVEPRAPPAFEVASSSTAPSRSKTLAIIVCVTSITGLNSFLQGIVTIALPAIASDLNLDDSLILWPISIFSLTCGATLLLCGSIADVVTSRLMYLIGCFLQAIFTLACGLSRSSTQLIVLRGFSGVAASFCLPSAVGIINHAFGASTDTKRRNRAFASMGGGQPIGFALGQTLGGMMVGSIGWRWGFHITAMLNFLFLVISIWGLPNEDRGQIGVGVMLLGVDWIGALIASSSLAMLLYVLAAVTGSSANVRSPTIAVPLALATALMPGFVFWVGRQERLGRPALIPNSLWRRRTFTSICVNVFLIWGSFSAWEQITNFYFQNIQHITALGAAVRFLPDFVAGIICNVLVAVLVHRVRANWIVIFSTVLTIASPLLMAIAQPEWTYWAAAFPAVALTAVAADGIFTVSNLLISSSFPADTQSLAGGVFQTIAQISRTVSLALVTLIANNVSIASDSEDVHSPQGLLIGYRAAFWLCFAMMVTSLIVSVWGLRKIGRVGVKED